MQNNSNSYHIIDIKPNNEKEVTSVYHYNREDFYWPNGRKKALYREDGTFKTEKEKIIIKNTVDAKFECTNKETGTQSKANK